MHKDVSNALVKHTRHNVTCCIHPALVVFFNLLKYSGSTCLAKIKEKQLINHIQHVWTHLAVNAHLSIH